MQKDEPERICLCVKKNDCNLNVNLVGRAGIEPATHGLRVRCSTN